MRIRMFVVCAAIGAAATLSLKAEQIVVAPSQGGDFVLRRPIEARVLKGQPYSAEILSESVQTLSDGNRIVHRTTGRVYRDVEGRVRREDDRPSGPPSVTISDPVANMSWTLDQENKTARETTGLTIGSFAVSQLYSRIGELETFTLSAAGGGGRGVAGRGAGAGTGGDVTERKQRIVGSTDAQSTQGARGGGAAVAGGRGGRGAGAGGDRLVEQLPNKSIENLLCSGVRRTTTIAKGEIGNEQPIKIVSEEWTSIDLQVLVLTDSNDPRSGRSTYKLLNVRRADPDLMLFRVPADYTISRGGGRGRGGN